MSEFANQQVDFSINAEGNLDQRTSSILRLLDEGITLGSAQRQALDEFVAHLVKQRDALVAVQPNSTSTFTETTSLPVSPSNVTDPSGSAPAYAQPACHDCLRALTAVQDTLNILKSCRASLTHHQLFEYVSIIVSHARHSERGVQTKCERVAAQRVRKAIYALFADLGEPVTHLIQAMPGIEIEHCAPEFEQVATEVAKLHEQLLEADSAAARKIGKLLDNMRSAVAAHDAFSVNNIIAEAIAIGITADDAFREILVQCVDLIDSTMFPALARGIRRAWRRRMAPKRPYQLRRIASSRLYNINRSVRDNRN